ncbi:MAG: hypothetical protein JWN61_1919 [Pseudonocardiales bacterium]|nr:hypothetical protein [Pseudonocardiales bacterium]
MVTALAVIAALLSVAAVATAVLALRILGQLRASVAVLNRGAEGEAESLLESSGRHAAAAEQLTARYGDVLVAIERQRLQTEQTATAVRAELAATITHLLTETGKGLRRVAMVRYDAFEDLAGRMSFSVALLDDHGDGVTITAINGRADSRVYAKGVQASAGAGTDLSPEEQQAVKAAMAR